MRKLGRRPLAGPRPHPARLGPRARCAQSLNHPTLVSSTPRWVGSLFAEPYLGFLGRAKDDNYSSLATASADSGHDLDGHGPQISEAVTERSPDKSRQLLFEDFLRGFLRTETSIDPGSNDQVIVSPSSRPRTATIGSGTVVRKEADRSIAFTSLDSYDFGTVPDHVDMNRTNDSVGQLLGRCVGSNLKYSYVVGRLIGQHMTELLRAMTTRGLRALEMLSSGVRAAEISTPGGFLVPSQSGKGLYRVTRSEVPGLLDTCECEDFLERNAPCKHVHFVRLWLKSPDQAVPPTLSQSPIQNAPKRDWSLYDRAQLEEGRLVRILLRDLANGFPQPFKDPRLPGRKPVALRDQAFCAVQRSYHGFSLRRSHDFRVAATEKELLSDPHSYSLISHFLCREDVTAGLHDMLARSAIPLIGLEDRCAIDSTGLRTSRFNYYRKEKYDSSRENVWLKLHALVGVKTHGVPALEVTAGSVGDSPQYPVLLRRAIENRFRFKEVYADNGYQSRENFNVSSELDVLPFIPFKSNQTGQAKGSPMYHKMFLFFQYHREEFDRHYGQRAQVESTFAAFKQKLSETLSSRKFTSQVNEILCMGIAHNIMVLVHQMFETNVLPDFLRSPTSAPAELVREVLVSPSVFLNQTGAEPAVPQSTFRQ